MRRSWVRGFTLVELMITVAIIGVLASIAITGLRKYLASARSAEAIQMVGGISRAAVVQYERERVGQDANEQGSISGHASHALCGTATPVPASVPTGKYQPRTGQGFDFNAGDSETGWPCLRFTSTGPISFRYQYKAGNAMITVASSTGGGGTTGGSGSSSTSTGSGSGSSGSGIASNGGGSGSTSATTGSGHGHGNGHDDDDDGDHGNGHDDDDDGDDHGNGHGKGHDDDGDDDDGNPCNNGNNSNCGNNNNGTNGSNDPSHSNANNGNKGTPTATPTSAPTSTTPAPANTGKGKDEDDDDDKGKGKGKGSYFKKPTDKGQTAFAQLTIPSLTGPGFEASAQGDQDGDGVLSTFSLTGEINPATGMLRLATSIFIDQETE
jgi:type IV pilus assembly protein PilA